MSLYKDYYDNQEVPIQLLQPHNRYRTHHIHVNLDGADPREVLAPTPSLEFMVPHPTQPFFLLRPTASQWIEPVRRCLEGELGLVITDEQEVQNFELCCRYLYPPKAEDINSYLWFMVTRKYLGNEAANIGHAFFLDSRFISQYNQIIDAKRIVRELLGITPFRVFYNEVIYDTDLHHIHAPDLQHLELECNFLRSFINLK